MKGKRGFATEREVIFKYLSAQGKRAKVKMLMSPSKAALALNCIEAPHLPSKTRL